MPPRDPELPEGTDHIVAGASGSSGAAPRATGGGGGASNGSSSSGGSSGGGGGSSGGSGGGFVASGGGSGGTTDKLVNQVREQVSSLRGQAGDKLRGFADDGKDRVTGLLDDFSAVIDDAARSIDERLGAEYGRYAHSAAEAVTGFTGRLREKSLDDILDDTRSMVRASPGIAIGIAAVAGFALMRIVKTGMDELSGGRGSGGGSSGSGGSGGGSASSGSSSGGTGGGA